MLFLCELYTPHENNTHTQRDTTSNASSKPIFALTASLSCKRKGYRPVVLVECTKARGKFQTCVYTLLLYYYNHLKFKLNIFKKKKKEKEEHIDV